jgi:hypothetical protein
MELRAAPAERLLAPLAVLVPIGGTPILAFWLLSLDPVTTGPVLALLALACGLAAIAVAGRVNNGSLVAVRTALLTWVVLLVSLPVWYIVDYNTGACNKTISDGWEWLAPTGGVLAFLALGSWEMRTHRNYTVVPLAGLLGVLVFFLLFALVPGTQGYCET